MFNNVLEILGGFNQFGSYSDALYKVKAPKVGYSFPYVCDE